MDKLIEKVVIEGVEFEIIQKPTTWYVGYMAEADSVEGEPSDEKLGMANELFEANRKNIKRSLTPDSMLVLSINYKECCHGKSALRSLMLCQESSEKNQPEGFTVLESPACYTIKAKSTEATWALVKKITGQDNPQWHMAPIFSLCEELFCNEERGFVQTPDFSNTYQIEYWEADGSGYASISVFKV